MTGRSWPVKSVTQLGQCLSSVFSCKVPPTCYLQRSCLCPSLHACGMLVRCIIRATRSILHCSIVSGLLPASLCKVMPTAHRHGFGAPKRTAPGPAAAYRLQLCCLAPISDCLLFCPATALLTSTVTYLNHNEETDTLSLSGAAHVQSRPSFNWVTSLLSASFKLVSRVFSS